MLTRRVDISFLRRIRVQHRLIGTRPIAFSLADLTPVAFERLQAGEIVSSESKEFGEVSSTKLFTAKKPTQLMIGDVGPQHEVGIVVFELFDCAVALASVVNRL